MTVLGLATDDFVVLAAAPLLIWAQIFWFDQVEQHVPEPYLDEVFHIPQANAFWQGNWSQWDDKITTPPGLYIYSIAAAKLFGFGFQEQDELSPYQLRLTNLVLISLLILACATWRRCTDAEMYRSTGVAVQDLCITSFPLIFFFSALYYTDLFSAFTVMSTYAIWQAGLNKRGTKKLIYQLLHVLAGVVSLTSRQTNIFWSAVFLGGLQVIYTIKHNTRVHDPPVADAYFEDIPIMAISLITSALNMIPQLVAELWPHLTLLGTFASFVVWNGGVVLGDKSNHTAGLHVPQMLYLWPFMMFFSWPVLLPQLAHASQLQRRLPRALLVLIVVLGMLVVVHLNTVVHPFLLADNRHYTFYVFKILRLYPWLWYAMTPIYALCAWLSIQALGSRLSYSGGPGVKDSRTRRLSTASGLGDLEMKEVDTNRSSFVLVWALSTALSLVSAPLVEPRYLLIPWLIWRLHIPHPTHVLKDTAQSGSGIHESDSAIERLLTTIAKRSLLIELVWYGLINYITCRLFLYKGFNWPQEPGKTQRFMW